MGKLIEALKKIIVLGLSQNDLYCRTCGTWLKGRNDIQGHNKAFACGIAVSAITELSKTVTTDSIKEMLIEKVSNRLSGMTTEDWEAWKAQPYKTKHLARIDSPESLRNEAIEIITLINDHQVP